MFSYKPNAICMAGMAMSVGAGHAASHCWNRVRKPRQLINYARFWPQWWTFAKNRTAHAQTHYRKSTQWQWASFVSATSASRVVHIYWSLSDYYFIEKTTYPPSVEPSASSSCRGKLSLRCWAFVCLNDCARDCANGDEADLRSFKYKIRKVSNNACLVRFSIESAVNRSVWPIYHNNTKPMECQCSYWNSRHHKLCRRLRVYPPHRWQWMLYYVGV